MSLKNLTLVSSILGGAFALSLDTGHQTIMFKEPPYDVWPVDTNPFPPCKIEDIPHYTAYQIKENLEIDGHLDELVWKMAPKSDRFRDLVSGDQTSYATHAAVLWNRNYLYVGYWIEEPNLQASLTERDAPIYKDNDVELFIAGEDAYYELEINAFGTIYEVLFIWQQSYLEKGYDQFPEFDLEHPAAKIFNGVGFKHHPRGPRIGYWNWDLIGLKSAVSIDGTLNDDRDQDKGWYVEFAVPWQALHHLTAGDQVHLPPRDADVWRMDFSRFNQYKSSHGGDSGGWAWSPHGVWDSHIPECFTLVHFSESLVAAN